MIALCETFEPKTMPPAEVKFQKHRYMTLMGGLRRGLLALRNGRSRFGALPQSPVTENRRRSAAQINNATRLGACAPLAVAKRAYKQNGSERTLI